MLVIPLCALLLASGIWNVRQYRLVEQQRLRAVAAEREARAEAARAEAEAERARLKKKAADAEAERADRPTVSGDRQPDPHERAGPAAGPEAAGTPVKKDGRGEAAGAP